VFDGWSMGPWSIGRLGLVVLAMAICRDKAASVCGRQTPANPPKPPYKPPTTT